MIAKQEWFSKPKRVRRLFLAGKINTKRNRRPCRLGSHVGHLLDTEKYDEAGGIWEGVGTCSVCGSTIHSSQLRKAS